MVTEIEQCLVSSHCALKYSWSSRCRCKWDLLFAARILSFLHDPSLFRKEFNYKMQQLCCICWNCSPWLLECILGATMIFSIPVFCLSHMNRDDDCFYIKYAFVRKIIIGDQPYSCQNPVPCAGTLLHHYTLKNRTVHLILIPVLGPFIIHV